MSASFADLSGLRATVTGASSGIGKAIALELARGGANVVVHCRQSLDAAFKLADQIQEIGCKSEVLTADLANPKEYEEFENTAWQCFDGLDIWINNAGADLLTGPDAELDYDQKLQRLFDIDVRSTVGLSRSIGKRMSAAEQGTILNVGWDQAGRGMEGDSGELFATAKNAIMGFTRSLAVSLAPAVRVNCVAPGWIRTSWGEQASDEWQDRVERETPLKRWGTPEDVAKVARFLVSRDAEYLTGQVVNVNGGAVR